MDVLAAVHHVSGRGCRHCFSGSGIVLRLDLGFPDRLRHIRVAKNALLQDSDHCCRVWHLVAGFLIPGKHTVQTAGVGQLESVLLGCARHFPGRTLVGHAYIRQQPVDRDLLGLSTLLQRGSLFEAHLPAVDQDHPLIADMQLAGCVDLVGFVHQRGTGVTDRAGCVAECIAHGRGVLREVISLILRPVEHRRGGGMSVT